jgi:phytoene/squalene synthetase
VEPFAACEATVRRHDAGRFFAALFAPAERRRHLFALYAFYYELVHASAREPMLAEIRLAWWRETLQSARAGSPCDHAVARALAVTLAEYDLPQDLFERMIAARTPSGDAFTEAQAEAFGADSAGALMALSARLLGCEADGLARDAGIAYALAGQSGGRFVQVDTAALARKHLAAARAQIMPRGALAAFLPAALVPLYLKRAEPALWRKLAVLLTAGLRGHL